MHCLEKLYAERADESTARMSQLGTLQALNENSGTLAPWGIFCCFHRWVGRVSCESKYPWKYPRRKVVIITQKPATCSEIPPVSLPMLSKFKTGIFGQIDPKVHLVY